jgi:AraC-like DNA-binding protein
MSSSGARKFIHIDLLRPDIRFFTTHNEGHPHHELILVVTGRYEVRMGKRKLKGEPGDLFYVPAGCRHTARAPQDYSSSQYLLRWEGGADLSEPGGSRDTGGRVLTLLEWLRELRGDESREAKRRRNRVFGLALEQARVLLEDAPSERGRLADVKYHLDTNYDMDVNMNVLASIADLSHSHLTRLFKKEFGVSPFAYLKEVRIRAARSLLLNTRLPLREIAGRVGLHSEFYLSRLVKEHCGLSPKALRERME